MRVWILVGARARELLVVVGEGVLVVVDVVDEAEKEVDDVGIGVVVVQSMSVILFSKLENR